jgi:hypothetical protein
MIDLDNGENMTILGIRSSLLLIIFVLCFREISWTANAWSSSLTTPDQSSSASTGPKQGSSSSNNQDDTPFKSEVHRSFLNLIPDAPPPGYAQMVSKWLIMVYGFSELDTI